MNAKKTAWMVTDTATHSGAVFKAVTAVEAARRAVRSSWVRGATTVLVASFAGQDAITRQTFDVLTLTQGTNR